MGEVWKPILHMIKTESLTIRVICPSLMDLKLLHSLPLPMAVLG
jgi:hypothetical protein